ncbi:hypothetical protein P691DRAFT_808936 [Macrolepiota fuliginosa MF-IS2]|uniref:Uncharacterized protein n=1 Tax=Macrolepiota fuliginosa MF-IS2 TaxID=1400762 RepID=A0A9P5X3P0_9AGAR|nr:hypothetical protein P691DRAFT_808936 [Macrolepiota fuliginosa MF-IS2]
MWCFTPKLHNDEPIDDQVKPQPGDLVFLLIGTVGTDADLFADEAMQVPSSGSSQTTCIRVLRRANIPGIGRPVAFIVAPGVDQENKEDHVVKNVKRYLEQSQHEDLYVDHILFFPQDPLKISPVPPKNRTHDLASLCRGTNQDDVYQKISLIIKDQTIEGRPLPVPGVWNYFIQKGTVSYFFNGTIDSAWSILRAVAPRIHA